MSTAGSYYRRHFLDPGMRRALAELEQRAAVDAAMQATCAHDRHDVAMVETDDGRLPGHLERWAMRCTGCGFDVATYAIHPADGWRLLTNYQDAPEAQAARLAAFAAADAEASRLEREELRQRAGMARWRRRGIR